MKSLWNDTEAAQFLGPLGPRVYSSRLLGRDKSLVLHGGGNTSVKLREKNLFGEDEDVLYVKGSGWDLETIDQPGFAPVALGYMRRLAALTALSDTQMMNELTTHTLRAGAPAPSVETLLHAILPDKYVDHTHADAVLAVSNSPDGASRAREIYGDKAIVLPYVMAGFQLSAQCAQAAASLEGGKAVGMVLLSHGVISWGADARESYERMIDLVTLAERYLEKRKAWAVGDARRADHGDRVRERRGESSVSRGDSGSDLDLGVRRNKVEQLQDVLALHPHTTDRTRLAHLRLPVRAVDVHVTAHRIHLAQPVEAWLFAREPEDAR
jgi:rhamnose utilization protein RhaD (predicted bifunctional aldolase and dehydrogenase)